MEFKATMFPLHTLTLMTNNIPQIIQHWRFLWQSPSDAFLLVLVSEQDDNTFSSWILLLFSHLRSNEEICPFHSVILLIYLCHIVVLCWRNALILRSDRQPLCEGKPHAILENSGELQVYINYISHDWLSMVSCDCTMRNVL